MPRNITIFIFLLLAISLRGQDKKFTLHSIHASAGFYKPSLNYWNNSRLPEIKSEEFFSWAPAFGVGLDYSLVKNIRTRLDLSRWSDKVTPGNIDAFRSLEISFTSFSLGLLYSYELSGLDLYGGVKGAFFLVQNKYELLKGTGNLEDREQGQDYSGSLILGINKTFDFGLLAGMELNYTIGNYDQAISSGGETISEKIRINGPSISLKIGYRFE